METPNTPCRSTCKLNDDDYCIGCYRHMREIALWNKLSNEEKQAVIDELPKRREQKPYAEQDLTRTRPITSVEYRKYRK